eukprot:4301777-Ditylum_brightwellii.AAC.1
MQGPPCYTVAKTLLRGNALTVFEQADIDREHVFSKKPGQTQKRYMQRNLWLVGEMTKTKCGA